MYVTARSEGAYTYDDVLELPWFMFVGYLEIPAPGSFMEYWDKLRAAGGCAFRA